MKERLLYKNLWKTLSKFEKMVFISGPRQSGKTTLSKIIAKDFPNSLYFNYDIEDNKKQLIQNPYFYEEVNRKDSSKPLIIFDEIHKYNDWKNYLKGVYDRDGKNYIFLVTGSGRLDLFQKGGDSLTGRYFMMHLWPFTIAELCNNRKTLHDFLKNPLDIKIKHEKETRKVYDTLFSYSGFPDPYLKSNRQFYTLWSETYKRQLIREDIRELTDIKKIDAVNMLAAILPDKIGSPLSMNNIAGDIKVSFDSIKSWLQAFDNFYISFRLSPWTKKISRAISKEKKIYLFDYANLQDEGARFENMVALELFRAVTSWNAEGLGIFSIHYIRNKENEEVDFLVAERNKPIFMVECKLNYEKPSKILKKMQSALDIPAIQLVQTAGCYRIISNKKNQLAVISADQWLSILP